MLFTARIFSSNVNEGRSTTRGLKSRRLIGSGQKNATMMPSSASSQLVARPKTLPRIRSALAKISRCLSRKSWFTVPRLAG